MAAKFGQYTVYKNGKIKNGKKELKFQLRERRGGKFDYVITLYVNGKPKKFTVSRILAECFLGEVDGKQVNHKNRNTLDIRVSNLEIVTASENQLHWRRSGN